MVQCIESRATHSRNPPTVSLYSLQCREFNFIKLNLKHYSWQYVIISLTDFQPNDVRIWTSPSCTSFPLDILDSLNITCHTLHFGNVKWFKEEKSSKVLKEITDGRLVDVPSYSYRGYAAKDRILSLINVTKQDSGIYICVKSNGFNLTGNVTVHVNVAGM